MIITAEPRSDQWNADDFIGGPKTFTIAGVIVGKAEQKYDIELVEGEGRAWRPPLTVLRQLMAAWTDEATTWVGRRVKLYRDGSVKFGGEMAPGIRIAEMSDLPDGKPLKVSVTVSRGKRASTTIRPLTDEPAKPSEPTAEQVAACIDPSELRRWWKLSGDEIRTLIEARVAELTTEPEPDPDDDHAGDIAAMNAEAEQ